VLVRVGVNYERKKNLEKNNSGWMKRQTTKMAIKKDLKEKPQFPKMAIKILNMARVYPINRKQ
jgi:hypothetical protein